ncbi:uncharacterized protein LOC108666886 isoform X2 [Hyalella azteca]|uniref:Uncharacterized protein LOC108666886 isoform X2 n=1 Tax=Hyalella azteca TaxID=294128 RepID=A0A979FIN4_HYAAZ|nr:uncharacterized protein LOC108666886 isoform X2 [Hyalella azteca]
MLDSRNMSGRTAVQQLMSRSLISRNRSQFVREMELRMCKSLVEFETEMSARNRIIKMEFNHNGSRLVRVHNGLVEVYDPRTRRVVHTLPRNFFLSLKSKVFEFTDVDHELLLECWSVDGGRPELQLWDVRFSSSHAGRIHFRDEIMAQYAYSKKERSLLTKTYNFISGETWKLAFYNKSSDTWTPTLQVTWFGLAPDDSCLVFQPTPESFLAVHNPSFATLEEALKQFEDGRLKIFRASGPNPSGLGVMNKLTHMVHDSRLTEHFKICPRGNFIIGDPCEPYEKFRVYSFDHDVPTSKFQQNPPTLISTAQFTASGDQKFCKAPFILSETGEIVVTYDISGTIGFYHLRAPVLTERPIDLHPFNSFTIEKPSVMALSPNLDIFVTGHASGIVVWYYPRL